MREKEERGKLSSFVVVRLPLLLFLLSLSPAGKLKIDSFWSQEKAILRLFLLLPILNVVDPEGYCLPQKILPYPPFFFLSVKCSNGIGFSFSSLVSRQLGFYLLISSALFWRYFIKEIVLSHLLRCVVWLVEEKGDMWRVSHHHKSCTPRRRIEENIRIYPTSVSSTSSGSFVVPPPIE